MVYSNVAAGTIFGVLVAIVLAVSSYLVESVQGVVGACARER